MTPSYPSNLTQDQWELLKPLLPDAKPGGRPRNVDLQAVVRWRGLADATERFSQVENGVPLFPSIATGWNLG